jgi:putative acetyltransferase
MLPGASATVHGELVLIRRESGTDADVIGAITAAAFARPDQQVPPEVGLVDELRGSQAWIPALSLVAIAPGGTAMGGTAPSGGTALRGTAPGGTVIGHVLCTRGHVGHAPVLALGPLSVRPDQQGRGVGSALMHAVLGAADALGEPLVALLGDPAYYGRFGFRLGAEYRIDPPVASWQPHFQVRLLDGYRPGVRGTFRYAEPFSRV